MAAALSAYELQREANIANNHKRLAELGLEGGLALKKSKTEPKPARPKKRPSDDPDWKPERTTRVSGRTAAAAVPTVSDDSDDDTEPIPKPKAARQAAVKAEPKPAEAAADQCIVVEAAKTGRSKCRGCMEPLAQGEMRVGMESWMVGRAVIVWQHPRCFADAVAVTLEASGRGRCKQTKEPFAAGEARVSCTAHSTTSHFKPHAVAAALHKVFALAGRDVQLLVETVVFVVAQPLTSGSPGGSHLLWAALHTLEEPPSHWARSQQLSSCL